MRRKWFLFFLCCLTTLVCRAEINCPDLFLRPSAPGTAYVLAFIGGTGTLPTDKQERNILRGQLQERVTPRLQLYVQKLEEDLPLRDPLEIVFLSCDYSMRGLSFTSADADTLSARNVIGILWSGSEGGKASVIHLSIPYYQARRPTTATQIEVAWLHTSGRTNDIHDWMAEFDSEPVAYQAMFAMGVGYVSLKNSNLQLAKRSFCQARSNLKLMTEQVVARPTPALLQQQLGGVLRKAISDLDARAQRDGIDFEKYQILRLSCHE